MEKISCDLCQKAYGKNYTIWSGQFPLQGQEIAARVTNCICRVLQKEFIDRSIGSLVVDYIDPSYSLTETFKEKWLAIICFHPENKLCFMSSRPPPNNDPDDWDCFYEDVHLIPNKSRIGKVEVEIINHSKCSIEIFFSNGKKFIIKEWETSICQKEFIKKIQFPDLSRLKISPKKASSSSSESRGKKPAEKANISTPSTLQYGSGDSKSKNSSGQADASKGNTGDPANQKSKNIGKAKDACISPQPFQHPAPIQPFTPPISTSSSQKTSQRSETKTVSLLRKFWNSLKESLMSCWQRVVYFFIQFMYGFPDAV